ncbi:MAG: HK97 gp10 family phage protein [Methanobrevibacter sp.]|uniref:HK97 gp10 family phage protein n=1 Tax=Methanobrevibacter sp. TaxID=66852 RepID=UPI0026E01D40|nr:HK97 gp10 family phage protein [Methanobrevibacter sp.]MDO5849308.1 HK97 gp10 family phage protein [Methanobrevibacter sp.]
MININVETGPRIEKMLNADFDKVIENALIKTGLKSEGTMKKEAPVVTGTLRRSIGMSHPNMTTVCITAGVKYWVHVQYGTAPHQIKVKNKKALSDGKVIYGKSVQHPGSHPNPFVTRTANKTRKFFQQLFRQELKNQGYLG